MALFVATGIRQLLIKGLNNASVVIDVEKGCPNGIVTNILGITQCSNPAPYIYGIITDDDATRMIFWVFGCLLALANFLIILKVLWNPAEHFARQSTLYVKSSMLFTFAAAMLAIGAAGGSTGALTEQYYDCRNATQLANGNWTGCVSEQIYFPGSPSGFWDVWEQSKIAIAEGIFAW